MRLLPVGNEKLRSVGVGAVVGHGENSARVMLSREREKVAIQESDDPMLVPTLEGLH